MALFPLLDIIFWNAWCCLAIGLCLNVLLVHLAWHHSSRDLKQYSYILCYFCGINSCILLLQAFTQPIFFTIPDGCSFVFLNGPIVRLLAATALWLRHLFFSFLFSFIMLLFATLALQFLDRYLIICRSHSNKFWRHAALSLSQKVFLIVSILVDISISPSTDYNIGQLLDNVSDPTNFSSTFNDLKIAAQTNPTNLVFMTFALSLLVCNGLILFCYWRIRRFLRRNLMLVTSGMTTGSSAVNRETNRQITRNMALHALLPLYVLTIYCANFVLSAATGSGSAMANNKGLLLQLQMLSFVPINWLPVLYPLVSILTIGNYRNALLILLRLKRENSTTIISYATNNNIFQQTNVQQQHPTMSPQPPFNFK